MSRYCLLTVIALALLPACYAQNPAVTAHFDIVRQGGKVKNKNASQVVVWLSPIGSSSAKAAAPQGRPPRLVQKNKSFSPHLLVIPAGSVVEFPNRDPFFHNVFSLFEGKRFDLGLYEAGGSRMVHFNRPGVSYVFCNIHPEMSAMIVVVDTPYYGVSNAAGEVTIPDVPEGDYVLHVWSELAKPETLEALTRHVTISSSSRFLGNLRLSEMTDLWLSHDNKYGQTYETPSPSSPVYVQR